MSDDPEFKNHPIPVYIPGDNGEIKVEVGKGSLKAGTLVVEFNTRMPAAAIQHAMERGVLLGLAFVMMEAKEEADDGTSGDQSPHQD